MMPKSTEAKTLFGDHIRNLLKFQAMVSRLYYAGEISEELHTQLHRSICEFIGNLVVLQQDKNRKKMEASNPS